MTLTRRQLVLALVGAVVLIVAFAYAPSLDAAYVWDDDMLVAKDTRCRGDVLRCFSLPFFPQSPFLDVPRAYYRPIVTASFTLVATARAQHGMNVFLHAANAALLLALALKHGASPRRAAIAAMVWALHPRLVESVTWVVGRTDLLCATFTLGALAVFPFDEPEDPKTRRRLALTGVLVFFALLSKEAALAGAAAIFVASVRMHGTRKGLERTTPVAVALALYGALRVFALRDASVGATASQPLDVRIATPFETLARYALMAARFYAPWSSRGTIGVVQGTYVVAGVLIALALVLVTVRVLRRASIPVVAFTLLALISLVLVLQIIPVGLQGALAADRLLYLPLAGLVLALAVGAPKGEAKAPRPREALLLALGFALAAASSLVVRRTVTAFADDVLFLVTVAEQADATNTGPRSAVAAVVRDRGDAALACELFARSRTILRETGRAKSPAYRRATEQVGACLVRTGRVDDAVVVYRELADTEPTPTGRVQLGLGYALLAALDFEGADAAFARAAEIDPKVASLATKLRSDVQSARRTSTTLDAADGITRARFAANAGRALDAERAWASVANDPAANASHRVEAARYLALDGDIDVAQRAYDACEPCREVDPALGRTLAARRALLGPVRAHAARIAALR